MMENFLPGPICGFDRESNVQDICYDLLNNSYVPILILTKGPLFDRLFDMYQSSGRDTVGIIVSMGFRYSYT